MLKIKPFSIKTVHFISFFFELPFEAVCDSLRCLNGGLCEVKGGNAECNCIPGYSGRTCQLCKHTELNISKINYLKLYL